MNAEIVKIFDGFAVNGKEVPVRFLTYEGHGEPYVIFSREYDDSSYAGDDSITTSTFTASATTRRSSKQLRRFSKMRGGLGSRPALRGTCTRATLDTST